MKFILKFVLANALLLLAASVLLLASKAAVIVHFDPEGFLNLALIDHTGDVYRAQYTRGEGMTWGFVDSTACMPDQEIEIPEDEPAPPAAAPAAKAREGREL